MAVRNPIVLISGQFQELIAGDTVNGVSGGLVDFTDTLNIAAPNATVPAATLTATNAAVDVDFVIAPKGAGAVLGAIPNNAISGGNKRGQYAVDFQTTVRTLVTQVASGAQSVIVGGLRNTASGSQSVVVGGLGHIASAQYSSILGGSGNSATATGSTVGGGQTNLINSTNAGNAVIGGGSSNTVSQLYGTISGGANNVLTGQNSVCPGGNSASDFGIYGRYVRSAGPITRVGDSQYSEYTLRCRTTDATVTTLTTTGTAATATNTIVLQDISVMSIRAEICAVSTTGVIKVYSILLAVKRVSGVATVAIIGTPTSTIVAADTGASSWAINLSTNTSTGAILFTVTGAAATTINWTAVCTVCEVAI